MDLSLLYKISLCVVLLVCQPGEWWLMVQLPLLSEISHLINGLQHVCNIIPLAPTHPGRVQRQQYGWHLWGGIKGWDDVCTYTGASHNLALKFFMLHVYITLHTASEEDRGGCICGGLTNRTGSLLMWLSPSSALGVWNQPFSYCRSALHLIILRMSSWDAFPWCGNQAPAHLLLLHDTGQGFGLQGSVVVFKAEISELATRGFRKG